MDLTIAVSERKYFSATPGLPFMLPSYPGPEGSVDHVSVRAGVSDEGEVTDPALFAPEGGAAVVDPGCRGGEDTGSSIEEGEVLW